MCLVHEELRRIARNRPGMPFGVQSLRTTEIVNESLLRLFGKGRSWKNLDHFMGFAVLTIKSVLIDYAKHRGRKKRKAEGERVPYEAAPPANAVSDPASDESVDQRDLAEALELLKKTAPLAATTIELQYYAGLRQKEISATTGIPLRTVERELRFARAWLREKLA